MSSLYVHVITMQIYQSHLQSYADILIPSGLDVKPRKGITNAKDSGKLELCAWERRRDPHHFGPHLRPYAESYVNGCEAAHCTILGRFPGCCMCPVRIDTRTKQV